MFVTKVKAVAVLMIASLLATGTGVVAYQISTERRLERILRALLIR